MTEEQIYEANMAKLKTKDCYIFKKKNTYYMYYYGVDEKLPKDSWLGILQINAYNPHFCPTWLLEDGEQTGGAMAREIFYKFKMNQK